VALSVRWIYRLGLTVLDDSLVLTSCFLPPFWLLEKSKVL